MDPAGPSTRSVHLTDAADPVTGAVVPSIAANAAFAYPDVDTWLDVALRRTPGHIYSRNSNPTTDRFEAKVAALEGAAAATSFTTGMAAISSTLLALLSAGGRAVSVKDAYGGSYLMFTEILPRFGIDCEVVDTDDQDALEAAIARGCDLLYLESPTNPTLKVLDLERCAAAGHDAGATVVVDNTFATPINQQPLALGADLVVHSATKFLGGHGDVLGGVVCGSDELVARVYHYREIAGTGLDASAAALFLRSLKTLGLRVERQNANAMAVATWLEQHPRVTAVHYPGLERHPRHEVARRQMPGGFGGMLSFELDGGFDAVREVLPRLRYAYLAANLGQVETIVGPPATTSHVELTADERAAAGHPGGTRALRRRHRGRRRPHRRPRPCARRRSGVTPPRVVARDDTERRVLAAIDEDAVVARASELIAVPSLSGAETPAQELAADQLARAGMEVETWDLDIDALAASPWFSAEVDRPDGRGVLGWAGRGVGPALLINGHVDVVPPGHEVDWTAPAFTPVVRDGRLYGRGACDMKGGLAAAIHAVEAIRDAGVTLAGRVGIAPVVGEEDGGTGTLALIAAGPRGRRLRDRRADRARRGSGERRRVVVADRPARPVGARLSPRGGGQRARTLRRRPPRRARPRAATQRP